MTKGKNRGRDDRSRELGRSSTVAEHDKEGPSPEAHVVFDFSGLDTPDVSDLALILTARLRTPPDESVWVRAIHPKTERVLHALGLAHLFRSYPDGDARH